mgnify:FL=1
MKPRNKVYCYAKEEKEEKRVNLCLKSLLGNVWSFCKQPALSKKSLASYIILIIAALYQVRSKRVRNSNNDLRKVLLGLIVRLLDLATGSLVWVY